MKTLTFISFLSLFVCSTMHLFSQTDSIEVRMQHQLAIFPQEKIHLHLDKTVFVSGEKIWLRAYLIDATTHCPNAPSRYIYVELISPKDSLVSRIKIKPDDNKLHHGHIPIPEDVASGEYLIRAYTNFMRNKEEDYFFHKTVYIGNPSVDNKHEVESKSNDFDVSFFPQGGYFPAGTSCDIAFKAIGKDGLSEEIEGVVVDRSGEEIVTFKTLHNGMGVFPFRAEANEIYYAVCKNKTGIIKRIKLPQATKNTYSLKVGQHNNAIFISALKSSDILSQKPLFLFIHSRGLVQYAESWNSYKETLVLDTKHFPSGVLHILLLDESMTPISERLIFCNNQEDQAIAELSTDKPTHKARQRVNASIKVTNSKGKPLEGSISVSVTNNKDIQADTCTSILSSLLLSSELKGKIESPAFYFQKDNQLAIKSLDILMLTQGWRRYDIPKIVQGKYDQPYYPIEMGQQITGSAILTGSLIRRGVKNGLVHLVSADADFVDATSTDDKGYFTFSGFELPDSTEFILQALTNDKKDNVILTVAEETFPKRNKSFLPMPANKEITKLYAPYLAKADRKYILDNGMRMIYLQEVEVQSKRRKAPETIYANASNTVFTSDQLETFGALSVTDVLKRIPGISVDLTGEINIGNDFRVIQRGLATDTEMLQPLIIIDDIPMDEGYEVNNLHLSEIEAIGVIKGIDKIILGSRGAAGAIVITTKSLNHGIALTKKSNILKTKLIGYQKAIEFYSPKYEVKMENQSPDLRTTIYWKPDVILSKDGIANFDFYTSDGYVDYTIVMEGITSDCQIIQYIGNIN